MNCYYFVFKVVAAESECVIAVVVSDYLACVSAVPVLGREGKDRLEYLDKF